MSLTPGQCRAARGLLGWSQADLSEKSRISPAPIANFERGATTPQARTLRDLRTALENAGIEFLDEVATGVGVKLQPGLVESALRRGGAGEAVGGDRGCSPKALPDDPDLCGLYDYWRERREEWQGLSDPSRRAVLREIFGELPEGDPIIEWPETETAFTLA